MSDGKSQNREMLEELREKLRIKRMTAARDCHSNPNDVEFLEAFVRWNQGVAAVDATLRDYE